MLYQLRDKQNSSELKTTEINIRHHLPNDAWYLKLDGFLYNSWDHHYILRQILHLFVKFHMIEVHPVQLLICIFRED
jgi:hypothetical protein